MKPLRATKYNISTQSARLCCCSGRTATNL